MNYKLKSNKGKATFLLKAGKDFVKDQMSAAAAKYIIDHGNVKVSEVEGYPISVDDKYFFEGESISNEETIGNEAEGE